MSLFQVRLLEMSFVAEFSDFFLSADIEGWKNDFPVNEARTDQQERNTRRECRKSQGITYKRHQEQRKSEADEEENVTRTSGDRGIRVGAVGQWRHKQRFGKTRTQSENSGTCERAPETDPHQQRRAQRKEERREICYLKAGHLQKHHQTPPEEKSAPQKDCRKNREQADGKRRTRLENSRTCERAPDPHQQRRAQRKEERRETLHWKEDHLQKSLQTPPEEKSAPQKDIRKKGEHLRTSRPADNQRDRGAHSVRHRMDEYGWRGAAQCWQRERRVQRSDAPQPPSHHGGRVSERGRRGPPVQSAPSRTDRNERTVRKPHWWQHDDRSVEPDEGQTEERHHKKYRNENRQWKSGRKTNASY